jgi:hypothetical protein
MPCRPSVAALPALALFAAACGRNATGRDWLVPERTGAASSRPAPETAAAAPRLPPPPREHPAGDGFRRWRERIALPAMSADGRLVALAESDDDGARALPNLWIELRRVEGDRILSTHPVLTVAEADAVESGEAPPDFADEMAARVRDANAVLAAHRWLDLTALEDVSGVPLDERDATSPHQGPWGLAALGWAVTFAEPRFEVKVAGEVVLAAAHPEWSATAYRFCREEDMIGMSREEIESQCTCTNPATFLGGWADPARGVLVLRIGYTGSDTCWEPDTRVHVVALPRTR